MTTYTATAEQINKTNFGWGISDAKSTTFIITAAYMVFSKEAPMWTREWLKTCMYSEHFHL